MPENGPGIRRNFTDHDLWQWVYDQFEFAKKHRDPQLNIWRNAERFLYGNHWQDSRMPNYKSRIVVNDVFEAIETMLPVITARAPKIEAFPRPSGTNYDEELFELAMEYAESLETEFDEIWRTTKMPRKSREIFRMMKTYGNGIIKSVKVKEKQEFDNNIVDIYTMFPDPHKGSIRDCEDSFFIHAPVMYTSEIKRRFGEDVEEEGQLDEFRSYQFAQQVEQQPEEDQPLSPVSDTEYERTEQYESTTAGVSPRIMGQALIIECYKYEEDEEKYPHGRVTIIARNKKDHIFYDGPRNYKYIPFFGTKNYSEAGSFWGRPEYKQISTLNRSTNMVVSQIVDNIRLTANPKYERVRAANIDKKQITAEPGSGILSSIVQGFRWIDPPKMPRYVLDLLNFLSVKTDNVTGVQDAWRGRTTHAGESGRHAEILRGQTAGRLQPAIEENVDMYKELGDHWTWVIQRMWKDTKYHVERNSEGGLTYTPFNGMIMNPGKDTGDAVDSRSVEFDIEISVGSMLPQDKRMELDETMVIVEAAAKGIPPGMLDALIDASPNIRYKARLKKIVRQTAGGPQSNGQLSDQEREILNSGDEDEIAGLLLAKPELRQVIDQVGGERQ